MTATAPTLTATIEIPDGDSLLIGDPCFVAVDSSTCFSPDFTLENAGGVWDAQIITRDFQYFMGARSRNAKLTLTRRDAAPIGEPVAHGSVDVESGMTCVIGASEQEDFYYDAACRAALDKTLLLDDLQGVCLSAGFGDGDYTVYLTDARDGGVAVITVEFIVDDFQDWTLGQAREAGALKD